MMRSPLPVLFHNAEVAFLPAQQSIAASAAALCGKQVLSCQSKQERTGLNRCEQLHSRSFSYTYTLQYAAFTQRSLTWALSVTPPLRQHTAWAAWRQEADLCVVWWRYQTVIIIHTQRRQCTALEINTPPNDLETRALLFVYLIIYFFTYNQFVHQQWACNYYSNLWQASTNKT